MFFSNFPEILLTRLENQHLSTRCFCVGGFSTDHGIVQCYFQVSFHIHAFVSLRGRRDHPLAAVGAAGVVGGGEVRVGWGDTEMKLLEYIRAVTEMASIFAGYGRLF